MPFLLLPPLSLPPLSLLLFSVWGEGVPGDPASWALCTRIAAVLLAGLVENTYQQQYGGFWRPVQLIGSER